MSTEAHEPVSPTWDVLRKLGEQCPHPLKVEGECLIVLDSDRRRFTDLGTPEMAQFVLASVNYVQGILAQPASPVLHNEKDLASYWKAAHDRVVAQNWELSRQIGALQKVGEQCLRPQQTPTGEGEAVENLRHILTGVNKMLGGNATVESPEDHVTWIASCLQGLKSRVEHALSAALAHPQQGGERDGAILTEMQAIADAGVDLAQYASYAEIVGGISTNRQAIRQACDEVFRLNGLRRKRLDDEEDRLEALAATPTSASKSSGEEA